MLGEANLVIFPKVGKTNSSEAKSPLGAKFKTIRYYGTIKKILSKKFRRSKQNI